MDKKAACQSNQKDKTIDTPYGILQGFHPKKKIHHSGESRNLFCAKRERRIRLAANEIPAFAGMAVQSRRISTPPKIRFANFDPPPKAGGQKQGERGNLGSFLTARIPALRRNGTVGVLWTAGGNAYAAVSPSAVRQ